MQEEKPRPADQGASGTALPSSFGTSPASLLSTPDGAELQAACVRALRDRALLVDAERLAERAAARLLHARSLAGGGARLDSTAAIEAALRDLDFADREAERRGDFPLNALEGDHAFLIHAFGIPPLLARAAALEFNGLDEPFRKAFFAFVLEGRGLEADPVVQVPQGSATIAAMVKRALQALFLVGPHARGGATP